MKKRNAQEIPGIPDDLRGVSVKETSAIFGVSIPSIYKMARNGQLQMIKAGNRTIVPLRSIKKLLEAA